jgi:peptidyl-dipeptidase A
MDEQRTDRPPWFRAAALGAAVALAIGCTSREPAPTVDDARAFLERAEQQLLELWIRAGRAAWVQNNFITDDTNRIAADAQAELIGMTMNLAKDAARFSDLDLPNDLRRKLMLLRTSLAAPAPSDPALQNELTEIATSMESTYGKGTYCPDGLGEDCLDLTEMERILAESRDTDELLDLWRGWRLISRPMRPLYQRFVELGNAGARELGFADLGELWRSGYDMEPAAFTAELERLREQVRPLYEALHCHTRAQLGQAYGTAVVPPHEPIPAHLLGNMWSQTWANVYPLVGPKESNPGYDLTRLLRDKKIDELEMVRYGERFFSSLGFEPLPETFWQRSLFKKPADRDAVCHASAWDIDYKSDVRVKMCIGINDEDFVTLHHELGHNYYQRAYSELDPLYRASANDGFHEGIGDTIALSITPEYLQKIGLLQRVPPASGDIGLLLRQALDKIAFLPFGLLVDQWRWQVFSGEISPSDYNAGWWKLREQYQGIRAPVARTEADFDPGAKYHVPANTPYTRYFLAHILQFQFHRALCEAAGFKGPLHRCSIFDSREAGQRLRDVLEMGASRPWPDALEAITGQRQMDATAILDYFAPLKAWLDERNQGRSCGW